VYVSSSLRGVGDGCVSAVARAATVVGKLLFMLNPILQAGAEIQ
jgi:hypothetical protein